MESLVILDLEGPQPYMSVLNLQHRLVDARHKGVIENDVILLLQHQPVFTLGHNGGRENLGVTDDFLRQQGIPVVEAERGGNITYHGPGQLIAYPILNLRRRRLRVATYVFLLEEGMLRTADEVGVPAERSSRNPGVWVGEKKLGSVGIAVRHGVSYHGLALNVDLSLEPFSWIRPCGLEGVAMTSLKEEGVRDKRCGEIKKILVRHLKDLLETDEENRGVEKSYAVCQRIRSL